MIERPRCLFPALGRRRVAMMGAILFASLTCGCAREVASQEPQPPDDGVLAVVDGEPIRLDDLGDGVGDQLALLQHQYSSQRFQVLDQALRGAVRERLLSAEAARRGIDIEALVALEITSQISVSDADISTWYQANQARLQGRSLEMLRPAIEQFLLEQRQEELLTEFADDLAVDSEVATYLEPYRAELEVDGHPTLGPDDAAVTLVEFSDFECPYCGRFIATLERVKSEYAGRLRLVYRQYPLRQIHPNAQKAAEASLCAAEQGRFWELHDLMFAEQSALDPAGLRGMAGRIGLDGDAFASCLDSGRYVDRIDEDVRAAQRLGVDGTPAVFVNGRPVVGGAVPFETLARIIDEELERTRR